MLGKSAGTPIVVVLSALALSCAHNVPQDAHSGEDGKIKGAKNIVLENGEGKAKGVVTYPGGDRVDWKVVELPEGKRGQLDVELKWVPPRPGLQLSFDIFDEWNQEVGTAKKTGKRRGRIKNATVDNAKGKYFIRVFAEKRGDAGTYKMTVDFKEAAPVMSIDLTKIDIPEPPKLAAVPADIEPCDDTNFDPKKPECRSFCPANNPPPNWGACTGKCPNPPDPSNEACWTKVCPKDHPTVRAKACKLADFPPCDKANPDPENMKCLQKAAPQVGRAIKTEVQGNETIVTVAVGSDQGVGRDWKGKVLRGDSDQPMDGGDCNVINVGKRETVAKCHLTVDQIASNPKMRLSPP